MSSSKESKKGKPSLFVRAAKTTGTTVALMVGSGEMLTSGAEFMSQVTGHPPTTLEDLNMSQAPTAAQWLIEQTLLSPHGPIEAGARVVVGFGLAFYGVLRAVEWANRPA